MPPGWGNWLVADIEPNPGQMGALDHPASLVAFTRDLSRWAMDRPTSGLIEIDEPRPQAFRYPDRAWGGYTFAGGFATGLLAGGDPRHADVRCSYSAGYDPLGTSGPMTPEDLQYAVALTAQALADAPDWAIVSDADLGNTSFKGSAGDLIPDGARKWLSPYVKRGM